jgi:AraC-like DNA-binding protein
LVSSRIQRLLASPQELATSCMESSELTNVLGRVIEAAQAMAEKWSELTSQQSAERLRGVVRRVVLRSSEVEIEVDLEALASRLLQDPDASGDDRHQAPVGNHVVTLKCSFTRARRSGELRLVLPSSPTSNRTSTSPLLKAIVTAHGWRQRIIAGEIYSVEQLAAEANLNPRYVSRILRVVALSPRWVDAVLRQVQTVDYPLAKFVERLPLDWVAQNSNLGSMPRP